MNYIETNLQPSEEIKYVAKLHFFLFVQPILLLLIGAILISIPREILGVTQYPGIVMLFCGILSLPRRVLMKIGSFYAVTNKRVLFKTGVFIQNLVDLDIAKCEDLHIKQSALGRIFNFGTIMVVKGDVLNSYPFVANPMGFRIKVNEQL